MLGNLNNKTDEYHGFKLAKMLSILFVIFLILGLGIGLVVGRFTTTPILDEEQTTEENNNSSLSYEGIVTYVEPMLYPGENISFALSNERGKEIILLKAKDRKLEVAEGHFVTANGEKYKTKDGKNEYLLVDTIDIKNATN